MTVFNTFLKVFYKNRFIIIMYTVMLIVFGGMNMQTENSSTSFIAEKPDIHIINHDKDSKLAKNMINYIEKNANVKKIDDQKENLDDALFYRDISYIIEIPEDYSEKFKNGENPEIKVKSTGDYEASLAEILLTRYLKTANSYQKSIKDEEKLITYINKTLKKETKVTVTSKRDINGIARATRYYDFLNYSVLAGCVYVICLILSSFKEEKIKKRTTISSMSYRKYNRILLLSNLMLAMVLWLFYVILSFFLVKDVMVSEYGKVFILNSFVFNITAITIAFLIANLIENKNAINGIINVVALGSSFLCGAFVPMEWLPDFVLKVAHILPSYWYIKSNELLKEIEVINFNNLKPLFNNMIILCCFSIIFIIATNIVSRRKRKIG